MDSTDLNIDGIFIKKFDHFKSILLNITSLVEEKWSMIFT